MITNPHPIVIPATPTSTADGLWIQNMIISAPSPTGKVSIRAQIVPYASSNGILLKDKMKVLVIDDVFDAASKDLSVMTAMEAIFSAVNSQVISTKLFAPTSK